MTNGLNQALTAIRSEGKKMKVKIAVIIFTLLTGFSSYSYSADDEKRIFNNYVGLQASSISGTGASYGYIFMQDYMFKITGIYDESRNLEKNPSNKKEEDYIVNIWWNTGAELQKNFFRAPLGIWEIQGYGLAGGSFWYSKNTDPYYSEFNDKSGSWTAGIALGLRAIFFERLALDLSLGYQYKGDIEDRERYTGIAGGAGIYFLF